jgi:integrase/recombinase XerD
VTHLRKRMLEELQRRNYSEGTTRAYLQAVQQFAVHFGKSPDKLGPDDLRSYQAYLLVERKLAVASLVARVAALRFFFVRTLKRREFRDELPYPKSYRRLPTVLSLEEVARLIDAAGNLMQRALLMTLLRNGHAADRSVDAQGARYRQPAHDDPRRARQGRRQSRSATQPGAVGNAA